MKVHEIAELVGGVVKGDPELEIVGLCSIEDAREGCITFLESKK